MVMKLIGLGVLEYVRDYFNVFDALIVILSILELLLGWGSSVSVLRAFRLLRVVRVLRVMRLVRWCRAHQMGE